MSFLLAVAVTGCGGSGPGTEAPALRIVQPPDGAVTEATTVTVRGTASTAGQIVDVTVAGVPATSDDGFLTWRANVPLLPGQQTLVVEANDDLGGTATASVDVESVGPMLAEPNGIDYDESTDSAFVIDRIGRVVRIDAETGARTRVDTGGLAFDRPVMSPFPGGGTLPPGAQPPPCDLRFGGADGALWVTQAWSVIRIDLATGLRTQFATGGDSGGGGQVGYYGVEDGRGAARDDARRRLLVCDRWRGGLVAMDLSTGDQTVIVEGATTGLRTGIAFDPVSREVYAVAEPIRAIDADSGAVRVIPTPPGAPPISSDSLGACLSPNGSRLYVADVALRATVEINVATGDRRLLLGSGPDLVRPRGVALDTRRQRLLVVDAALDAIVAVSLATGERSLLGGVARGGGPPLHDVRDLARGAYGALHALAGQEVLRFAGADRMTIADVGTAGVPRCLAVDPSNGLVVAVDDPEGVYGVVGRDSPPRTISDGQSSADPLFVSPRALAASAGAIHLLDASDPFRFAIWRVDPATGARAILSDATHGSGPAPAGGSIVPDPATGRLLVLGGSAQAKGILAVDPVTGDREVLASNTTSGLLLALDAIGRRGFVVSPGGVEVVDLDGQASPRVLTAEGVPFPDPVAALYDPQLDAVLIADRALGAVIAVMAAGGASFLLAR